VQVGAQARDETEDEQAAGGTWRVWGVDFDARIAQIVIVSLTVLILAFNNRVVDYAYDRFVLEFLVPIAIILVLWREDPRRYGLTLGDWRKGLPITVAGVATMAVVIWIIAQQPDFRVYYRNMAAGQPTWRLLLDTAVDIFAWEFFCRGWLLWGLGRKYGSGAIWLQVIPFTLMHVYKPQLEQFSTILGGAFFGILAWRTRSILYGWLLHWFMMAWVLLLVAGQV
jgi:membrane protease YdiL (CAAX protease family)